jgi:hypothetical protein
LSVLVLLFKGPLKVEAGRIENPAEGEQGKKK